MKDISKLLESELQKIRAAEGNDLKNHLLKVSFLQKIPLKNHPAFSKVSFLINAGKQKIDKLPRAGFAVRWSKAHLKLITHIKRIEDLEKRQRELENEISILKKKWFRG